MLFPKIPPDQNPAKSPNVPPQRPRNASANRAQGRFANFAALRVTGWGRTLATPQRLSQPRR